MLTTNRPDYGATGKRFPKLRSTESLAIKTIQRHQRQIRELLRLQRDAINNLWIQIGWELWELEEVLRDEDYGSILKLLKISRTRANDLRHRAYKKTQYPAYRDELI